MNIHIKPRIYWRNVVRMQQHLHPLIKAQPKKVCKPKSGKVLVLSPHIDDEVIGCGGTIRLHVEQGDQVFVNYFADCTEIRQREALDACSTLGFNITGFWPYVGREWPLHEREIFQQLCQLVTDINPDLVYLPTMWDRSHDHLMLNRLMVRLLRETGRDLTLYGCEIWSPVHPNLIVDISKVACRKLAALQHFASQNIEIDWAQAALALNRYRALTMRFGEYAEGFLELDSGSFLNLWGKVYGNE
ncbi:MAG: PIG-L deacetylase family protein [Gammaproteobacteria bacterium]